MTCHSTGRLAHFTWSKRAPRLHKPHRTQAWPPALGPSWEPEVVGLSSQPGSCRAQAPTGMQGLLETRCCPPHIIEPHLGLEKSPFSESAHEFYSLHPLNSPVQDPPSHPSVLRLILLLAKEPCPALGCPQTWHHHKGLGCPAPRHCPFWAGAGHRQRAGRELGCSCSQWVLCVGCFPSHPLNTDVFSVLDPDRGG